MGFQLSKAPIVCVFALLFLSSVGCQQFTEEVKVAELPSLGSSIPHNSRIAPSAQSSQSGTNVKVKRARINERPYATVQTGPNLSVQGLVKIQ